MQQALLKNSAFKLVFFTLDQLLLSFAFLARQSAVYTLSIDRRAYYYQLRCPEQVKQHCVIRLLGKLFVPRALPMGLHASCTWGQGHSWGLVLACCHHGSLSHEIRSFTAETQRKQQLFRFTSTLEN